VTPSFECSERTVADDKSAEYVSVYRSCVVCPSEAVFRPMNDHCSPSTVPVNVRTLPRLSYASCR
jgi:hypothetical protein